MDLELESLIVQMNRCFVSVGVMGLWILFGGAVAAPAADAPKPGKIKWDVRMIADDYNEGVAVADVNRDGKPDIIAGPDWYEGPDWKRRPLRFVGTGNREFRQNNGDHAFDVNGDGWVDVISASWFSDRVCWYENPGKAGLAACEPWKEHLIADGQSSCEGTLLADIDGDAVPEIVPNSWDANRPATILRMTPGTKDRPPAFEAFLVGGKGFGHGMGIGDINGDGRPDLLVGKGWYEAPEGFWGSKWKLHEDFHFDHFSLPTLIVDVNGDGRNDIIVGKAHDYGLAWHEQGEPKDGKTTWTVHEIDKSFSQVHCLIWVDLDGDGRNEIVTGKRFRAHNDGDPGAQDPICLFRFVWNPASKSFERDTISYNAGVGSGMQIRAVDLDGDGRLDLVVAGKAGTFVLMNRGPA